MKYTIDSTTTFAIKDSAGRVVDALQADLTQGRETLKSLSEIEFHSLNEVRQYCVSLLDVARRVFPEPARKDREAA